MPWLINAAQLDKFRKSQKNVIVLDASWYLSTANRDAKKEFTEKHIVGARFFDIEAFNDNANSVPNMLTRDLNVISEQLAKLGITPEHKIMFYDNSDLHSSCRALWMMKVFGHNPNQLYVLDGGFKAWEEYAGKMESGEEKNMSATKSYVVNYQTSFIYTLSQMKTNLQQGTKQVIDVRHPVRYAGGPEHRAGLRSGHIPGSFSFPYFTMFEANGKWKPLEKIRKQLTGIGVDLQAPIVTMCGSGITAAILNFTLDLMNLPIHTLYDGSWSEWGADTLYPDEQDLSQRPVITSLET